MNPLNDIQPRTLPHIDEPIQKKDSLGSSITLLATSVLNQESVSSKKRKVERLSEVQTKKIKLDSEENGFSKIPEDIKYSLGAFLEINEIRYLCSTSKYLKKDYSLYVKEAALIEVQNLIKADKIPHKCYVKHTLEVCILSNFEQLMNMEPKHLLLLYQEEDLSLEALSSYLLLRIKDFPPKRMLYSDKCTMGNALTEVASKGNLISLTFLLTYIQEILLSWNYDEDLDYPWYPMKTYDEYKQMFLDASLDAACSIKEKNKKFACINLLLKAGANPINQYFLGQYGGSIRHAICNGDAEVLSLLINHNKAAFKKIKDYQGRSSYLAEACIQEKPECLEILLKMGCNPNQEEYIRNFYMSGKKAYPLEIAFFKKSSQLIQLLYAYGADPKLLLSKTLNSLPKD